jgi:ATP-dependent Clp protease ATP-binding subunit ClpA
MDWFESAKALLKRRKLQEEAGDSIVNFTPRAQQVLALAHREAERLGHNFIGTEHILLGLMALGQGVAVNVLGQLGLDLKNVRAEVEKLVGTGAEEQYTGKPPFTPRVKKVLVYARKEAKALHHTYVGTEHLLLGLLRENEGIAAVVLKNLGMDLEQVRVSILKELDPTLIPGDLLQPSEKPNKTFVKIRDWAGRNFGEEFTPRAVKALAFAREEAVRLHDNFVGTEHVLLGLIRMEKGVAVNVLKGLGLSLENARVEVEKRHGAGLDEKIVGRIPYTPRMKRVLKMARDEAKALKHTYIGTEHLLLALLQENEGPAAEVLKMFHVDALEVRKVILDELNPQIPPRDESKKNP